MASRITIQLQEFLTKHLPLRDIANCKNFRRQLPWQTFARSLDASGFIFSVTIYLSLTESYFSYCGILVTVFVNEKNALIERGHSDGHWLSVCMFYYCLAYDN